MRSCSNNHHVTDALVAPILEIARLHSVKSVNSYETCCENSPRLFNVFTRPKKLRDLLKNESRRSSPALSGPYFVSNRTGLLDQIDVCFSATPNYILLSYPEAISSRSECSIRSNRSKKFFVLRITKQWNRSLKQLARYGKCHIG
jgi:hypothetical protein